MKNLLKSGLVIFVFVVTLVVAFAGFLLDYNLDTYFGKDIPWYGDCVIGTILAPLNVTAAIVGWVLVHCDIPTPIFFPETKE